MALRVSRSEREVLEETIRHATGERDSSGIAWKVSVTLRDQVGRGRLRRLNVTK
jgi:hypothetical protein